MTAMLNTVRHTGQLTVLLRDDLDVPAVVHRASNTVWVNGNQTDEEILELVNDAVLMLLRPQLTAVDSPTAPQAEETITPRPKLRLVRAGGDL